MRDLISDTQYRAAGIVATNVSTGEVIVSRTEQVETIAKSAALCDATDLPSLAQLRSELLSLAEGMRPDNLEPAVDAAVGASDLIEGIVMRQVEDADEALREVMGHVEYIQRVIDAVGRGESIPAARSDSSDNALANNGAALDRDVELVGAWVESCGDVLATVEEIAIKAEHGQIDEEGVAEVRRRVHSLKGECGVLALDEAQHICHELESLIDARIDANEPFPSSQTLAVIDWLRAYANELSENANAPATNWNDVLAKVTGEFLQAESAAPAAPAEQVAPPETAPADKQPTETASNVDFSDQSPVEFPEDTAEDELLNDFYCEAKEHLDNSENALLEIEQDPEDIELINTVFRAFHTIKGVAGFMHLTPVVELAHVAETLLDAARQGKLTLTPPYVDLILQASDMMGKLVIQLEGGMKQTKGNLAQLIHDLDQAISVEPSGGIQLAASPQTSDAAASPAQAKSQTDDAASKAPLTQVNTSGASKRGSAKSKRADQTVKVSTGRMDALVDMVGELVIAQQMVVQDPEIQAIKHQRVKRNLTHAGKIIRDLQEVSMSLRMVTLKGTFQKMSRLVRDVSAKAGKHVNLVIEGEETELDRNVVEEIADPLVHMIRNACDHGIEPEAERLAAGKSPVGTLTLRAGHRGGSIVIEVIDDGRGLNREKILKKAYERELISKDRDPSDVPDDEVFNMVFLPGFSTADKITDISGRGVGMDVVRRNIEALRGKCEIQSKAGEGSTFTMRLPLTMAIIDGMVVRVGAQRYVIPTLSIEQSFRPTPDQIHTSVGGRGEMAMVRGTLLPIHRMRDIFGLSEGSDSFDETLLIVLEANGTRTCLLVDDILGQQQVVIKTLGTTFKKICGVSGGAILGDGRVALILDVGGLIDHATAASVVAA